MPPKTLLFAIHNHQPDGNFDHVFAQGLAECYRPLLDLLLEFPDVRCALHFTGPLLEWIEKRERTVFQSIRHLVERGQAELLGGGFYEPMLAVLPERDAVGQLAMMSDYLEAHFGRRPRGLWLAERVWEPGLPVVLRQAGLEYTMLDDAHFRYAGMEGPLAGYYVTEKAGAPVAVFPIDKRLRDAIPFRQIEEVSALLSSMPDGTYTYGDDGEKFGMWPGTKAWVWDEGWLRAFFRLLTERTDLVRTVTPSDHLAASAPTGRVYLPTASYEEMGAWSLPARSQRSYVQVRADLADRGALEQARPFLRGGIWQSFLAKYEEANFMHKKMVHVSHRLEALSRGATGPQAERLRAARQELYRAQCNCAYWHGLFGGLYLGYLRHALYAHLIAAETMAEPLETARLVRRDYDADFEEEILLEGPALTVYVKPSYGGAVVEVDDRARRFNLLNVLSRREEAYHADLLAALARREADGDKAVQSIHEIAKVKQSGLDALLVYDRHLRLGFVDHFLAPGTQFEDFRHSTYEELGDFVAAAYEVRRAEPGQVVLERRGSAYGVPLHLVKRIEVEGRRLRVSYSLEAARPCEILFVPELSLFVDTEEQRAAGPVDSPPAGTLTLHHDWLALDVRLRFQPEAPVWRFPLETASQSESGFERTYQGTVVAPRFRRTLAPGHPFETTFEVEITHA